MVPKRSHSLSVNLVLLGLVLSALAVVSLANSDKLPLEVYFESKCPHCRKYYLNTLLPGYEKLHDAVDIYLVPWGNCDAHVYDAKTDPPRYDVSCQHGEQERYGNLLMACIVKKVPDRLVHTRLIGCLISSKGGSDGNFDVANCAAQYNVDSHMILECAKKGSPEGKKIEYEMYQRTENLNPQHDLVPWTVLNHQYTKASHARLTNSLETMKQQICSSYKGSKDIPACRE